MAPATVHQLRPDTLTADLDQLRELRGLLRESQERERELTARVLAGIDALGVTQLRTASTTARVDAVTKTCIDPALFLAAVGDERALAAMSVSVERARLLLDATTLQGISKETTGRRLVVSGR